MWQRPASPMWCSSAFLVIQALWGQGITSIGVIYYIASTLLFWSRGDLALEKGWEVRGGQRGERPGRIKEAGVPADHRHGPWHGGSIFEIQVPDFVLKPLSMISQVTSPLALVFIGSVIRNMDLKTITLGRDLYAALAMRFVVVPAACVVFLNLVPMPKEMKEVFFMLSSMPAMAQMGIMARQYDSDYEFACTVITVTTLISMVTIPVFMLLMQQFAFLLDSGAGPYGRRPHIIRKWIIRRRSYEGPESGKSAEPGAVSARGGTETDWGAGCGL